jgi:hypothetical protein
MEQRHLKYLLDPQAYPEPTTKVRMLQTHVSYIFLTDRFAYKIKKPVDFGFLDFTTLERRRFYCEEEVRLNRRLCPDIYLGVVELRETDSDVCFYGEGGIVEYAVKMKRLPEEKMLHRLLARNAVGEADMSRIAATIAGFHQNAAQSDEINKFGSLRAIHDNWEENFQQCSEFVGITLTMDNLKVIRSWVEQFLVANKELFERRVSSGFIRECDGDIHLENICLDDRVYIFDCIEFNKRFSCSDTAADISFLLMDMDYHHRSDLAEWLLAEYVRMSGDTELHLLVDLYKMYRAVVRGKVQSFMLNDPNILPEDKINAAEHARLYFRLARGYILRQELGPCLIIFCGLMGSGKSSIAAALSIELGLETASSDAVRKKIASVPLHAHMNENYGEGIYNYAFTAAVYEELQVLANNALANGRSIIIDASFIRKRDRDCFRKLAAKYRARFLQVHTVCPEQETERRLTCRSAKAMEISDGRWELYGCQRDKFENIEEDEGETVLIDTSRPLNASVDIIITALGLLPHLPK